MMNFREYGAENGDPVLLLHGGGVAGWMWEPLRMHLDPALRVIVPDLPGHGDSAEVPYLSHHQTATDLTELIRATGAARATVVGFSLGAQLAIVLAADHPELVEHVVVISAQAKPLPAPGLTLALLGATAGLARREWFARLQAKELSIPADLLDQYVRTSASVSRQTLLTAVSENIRFTAPVGWSTFTGSALILAGAQEKALMHASVTTLQDALPHSAAEIIESAGHDIPLRRPKMLAQRVHDLLSM